jgi:hypothetical protein
VKKENSKAIEGQVKSEKGNQHQAGKGYEGVHDGHGRKTMRIHCKYGLSRRLVSR